jgi:signal transduction histidine kinase
MGLRGSIGVTLLGTALILAGLGFAWEWLFQKTSEQFAIHEVGRTAGLAGRAAIDPFITDELVAGNPAAVEKLAVAGTSLIRDGGVAHVEVWSATGQLLWADNPSLKGRVLVLEDEERALLENQGLMVELSAHEVGAPIDEHLLAVDFGTKTQSGHPVVVELFYPAGLLQTLAADERRSFRPLLYAAILLLVGVQLPVAIALRNRRKHLAAEREDLVHRSIVTSDGERRRIAAEVHDGAVQDLIGISIGLSVAAEQAPSPVREHILELAGETRRTVRGLRSLLNSIYPVEVPDVGWVRGLDQLIDVLRQRGVEVELDVPEVHPSPATQLLLLRVGREALRNVSFHAQASHVNISLTRNRTTISFVVTDDGVGFNEELSTRKREGGHLGLQLLYDLAEDTGATLVIDSRSGGGTSVHLEVEEIR